MALKDTNVASRPSRPLRVAIVHYRDAAISGGSLRVGETIANHVDPDRVAAEIVFAYGGPGSVSEQASVPCHFLGSKGPKDLPSWWRARRFFGRMRPDIIHFQDCVAWMRTALLGASGQKIAHLHARYRSRSERRSEVKSRQHPFEASQLLRAFLSYTDAQVCINNGARDSLLDSKWIKPERSYVVYNSVDFRRFEDRQDRAAARAALGLPADALLLGMVCRLVREKGCADLLPLMARLPARWHAVICGDGPERGRLQREIESRGLTGRVHLIGLQHNVSAVYASLDAYLFLSHYEPFGLVLAEAMASRVPVFGVAGDGEFREPAYPLVRDEIVELIPFARNGNYLGELPSGVLDKLAVKLLHFGARPGDYRDMIEQAHVWGKTCFDAPIQAEAMTRVYENVFANRDSRYARLGEFYDVQRKAGAALTTAGIQSSIAATA